MVYIALFFGAKPYSVSVVAIFIQLVMLVFRLYFTHKHVGFSYKQFTKDVLIPIMMVTTLSIIPLFLLKDWPINIWQMILTMMIEVVCIGLLILLVGMSRRERSYIINVVKQKI